MHTVGITGGIGSGKSLVCNIFSSLGIPVFYADTEAKNLLNTKAVQDFYYKEFGEKVFTNGKLDKLKIAQIIFSDKAALSKVNAFVHPLVNELFINFQLSHKNTDYVINEAALLIDNGSYKKLDKTILVCAPLELRIQRTMARDNLSREQIIKRVENQLPEEEKRKHADFIIENDGIQPVLAQVLKIHEQLKQKSE